MTREEILQFCTIPGKAIILRGIPGSGKSTLVEDIKKKDFGGMAYQVAHCSADLERTVNGVYIYKPEENGEMHGRCVRRFIEAAQQRGAHSYDVIVCDNTNCTSEEVAPYWSIANAYAWEPIIIEVPCDPEVGAARNSHNVPRKTVLRMADNLERSKHRLQHGVYRYEVLEQA